MKYLVILKQATPSADLVLAGPPSGPGRDTGHTTGTVGGPSLGPWALKPLNVCPSALDTEACAMQGNARGSRPGSQGVVLVTLEIPAGFLEWTESCGQEAGRLGGRLAPHGVAASLPLH